jgi:zinc transporter 7
MIKLSSTGADFNSLLLTLQSNMAPSHVWACTLGAIVAISILPLPFLFALKVKPGSRFMRVLLSFAVGSLLGDVFLHLLPHASHPHSHEHGHGHEHGHSQDTRVGQLVLLGMLLFFILEKLIRGMTAHSHAHTAEHQHNDQSARVGSRILHALADASHNFTDGMFLAASFLSAHRSNAGLPFYSMAVLYKPLVDVAVVLIHEVCS